jgi:hypothetical protein
MKSGKRSKLGKSVEKRAVLASTAMIDEARIRRDEMAKVASTGHDEIIGDADFK